MVQITGASGGLPPLFRLRGPVSVVHVGDDAPQGLSRFYGLTRPFLASCYNRRLTFPCGAARAHARISSPLMVTARPERAWIHDRFASWHDTKCITRQSRIGTSQNPN